MDMEELWGSVLVTVPSIMILFGLSFYLDIDINIDIDIYLHTFIHTYVYTYTYMYVSLGFRRKNY